MAVVLPPVLYVPALHACKNLQFPRPFWFWYVPAEHDWHFSCFRWLLYVPALQLVAAPLPTGQKVPCGHVTHCAALVIAPTKLAGLAVPPGHGSAAAAPSAQ